MLVRLIDFLQSEQITVMFTALTLNNIINEQTDEGVSSLVDAWVLIRDIESNGERNRGLYVIKSRGMKPSNQIREFVITNKGLDLIDVYLGPEGVLVGSAREAQVLLEETGQVLHTHAISRNDRELLRKRSLLQAKIDSLNIEFESAQDELKKVYIEEELRKEVMGKRRQKMTELRKGEHSDNKKKPSKNKN